jgi:hypothetical protein
MDDAQAKHQRGRTNRLRTKELRPVTPEDAATRCEWQECQEPSVFIRDTPWGDLPVCSGHAYEPLNGRRTPDEMKCEA